MFPTQFQQLHGIVQNGLTAQGTGAGPSPRIWSRLTAGPMPADGALRGTGFFEDFNTFAMTTAVASNVGRYAGDVGWLSYEDTGDAITQPVAEPGGAVKIAIAATNNNETWMQPGMATSQCAIISSAAPKLVLFEARIKVSAITTTSNFFVGLSEEGLAAADTFTDAGALGSKDLIGFWALEAASQTLKFGYRKAGQTEVTLATAATLVASTYIKVGFAMDPSPQVDPSKRITFYVNNEPLTTYVAESALDDATFPDAQYLNPLFGGKNNNAAFNLFADWIGVYAAQ